MTETCVVNRTKKRVFVEQKGETATRTMNGGVLTYRWHLKEIVFVGCQLQKKKRKESGKEIS